MEPLGQVELQIWNSINHSKPQGPSCYQHDAETVSITSMSTSYSAAQSTEVCSCQFTNNWKSVVEGNGQFKHKEYIPSIIYQCLSDIQISTILQIDFRWKSTESLKDRKRKLKSINLNTRRQRKLKPKENIYPSQVKVVQGEPKRPSNAENISCTPPDPLSKRQTPSWLILHCFVGHGST